MVSPGFVACLDTPVDLVLQIVGNKHLPGPVDHSLPTVDVERLDARVALRNVFKGQHFVVIAGLGQQVLVNLGKD